MQYLILIAVIVAFVWLIARTAKAKRNDEKSREEQLAEYDGLTFRAPKQISNEEYQRMRQKEMDVWERKYDLSSIQGIEAIPVPKRKQPSGGGIQSTTGQLEYYLMLKAGQYEKAGETDLALACYRKANALMPMSAASSYPRDTYMRLPRYLRKLRRFDEARVEEAKIQKLFPDGGVFELSKADFLANMKLFGHSRSHAEDLYKEYKAEREAERQKELYRVDYDWLWEFLPDICPKSFSGYMRMKNSNTTNYQNIVAEAAKRGYKIK